MELSAFRSCTTDNFSYFKTIAVLSFVVLTLPGREAIVCNEIPSDQIEFPRYRRQSENWVNKTESSVCFLFLLSIYYTKAGIAKKVNFFEIPAYK